MVWPGPISRASRMAPAILMPDDPPRQSPSFCRRSNTTGSAAFDAYKAETLRRLEEEQAEFNSFVSKLREARDREEFERFMADRNTAIEAEKTSLKS